LRNWQTVDHIFGIPGDYVVPFFVDAEKNGVRMVTTTHEPSAAMQLTRTLE
jgi:thiamine pyrophosphate-dependent acetolactate synthase large subunit-like protein